jgi:hypothetical protein
MYVLKEQLFGANMSEQADLIRQAQISNVINKKH